MSLFSTTKGLQVFSGTVYCTDRLYNVTRSPDILLGISQLHPIRGLIKRIRKIDSFDLGPKLLIYDSRPWLGVFHTFLVRNMLPDTTCGSDLILWIDFLTCC